MYVYTYLGNVGVLGNSAVLCSFFFSIWFTFPVASARHATLTRKASLGSSESYRFARFYIANCFSLKLSMYADFAKE